MVCQNGGTYRCHWWYVAESNDYTILDSCICENGFTGKHCEIIPPTEGYTTAESTTDEITTAESTSEDTTTADSWYETSGNISSEHPYGYNLDKTWQLNPLPKKFLHLQFSKFSTEPYNDGVAVTANGETYTFSGEDKWSSESMGIEKVSTKSLFFAQFYPENGPQPNGENHIMSDAKTWEICTGDSVLIHMVSDGYVYNVDYDGNLVEDGYYGFDLEWSYVDSCEGYTTPPPAATDFYSSTSSYPTTTNWDQTTEFDNCENVECLNGGTVR